MSKKWCKLPGLNLNYDDLCSDFRQSALKYGDDSKTVVNPLDDEEILPTWISFANAYQEGIINGDCSDSR